MRQKGLFRYDYKLRILRGDYRGFFGWVQCNHKVSRKGSREYEVRCDMGTEAEVAVMYFED